MLKKKRALVFYFLIFLLITVLFSGVNVSAQATNGVCGKNLIWEVNGSVLTISGTGEMDGYGWIYPLVPWDNKSITKIVIGEGVTSIGNSAFRFSSATEVQLPSTLKNIGWYSFNHAIKLKKIIIPSNVEQINKSAFAGCTMLTDVLLPKSLKTIGENAFSDCPELKTLGPVTGNYNIKYSWEGEFPKISSNTIEYADLSNITNINTAAFRNCTNLKKISVSKNLKTINTGAFENCQSLDNIVIPSGVTELKGATFSGCSSLKNIRFEGKIEKLGFSVFENCTSLQKFHIS